MISAKSKPSIAAFAASTPAAIAAKSTTIEGLPAVEVDSLSDFSDVLDVLLCSFGPDRVMEASDRDARDNDARESNLGLPFGCPLEFDPPLLARLRRFPSTDSSPISFATAIISSMRPDSLSAE